LRFRLVSAFNWIADKAELDRLDRELKGTFLDVVRRRHTDPLCTPAAGG
jgi:hypothetical protein